MTTGSSTTYKPRITKEDIDKFIGRTSVKDEIVNAMELNYYNGFERFVGKELKDVVSKNDIVRTWNIITRATSGIAKTKRLPFSRLNMVRDYKEYKSSYSKMGRKRNEEPSFFPIFPVEEFVTKAKEHIEKILLLFFKPWHFKVTAHSTGLTIWFQAAVNKIVEDRVRPGHLVTYYQRNAQGVVSGGNVLYPTYTPSTIYPPYTGSHSPIYGTHYTSPASTTPKPSTTPSSTAPAKSTELERSERSKEWPKTHRNWDKDELPTRGKGSTTIHAGGSRTPVARRRGGFANTLGDALDKAREIANENLNRILS